MEPVPGVSFGLCGHGAFRGLPSLVLDGFEGKGAKAAALLSRALSRFGMGGPKASVLLRSGIDLDLLRTVLSWNIRVSSETDGQSFPDWLSLVPFRSVVAFEREWLGFNCFSFTYAPQDLGLGPWKEPEFNPSNSNCLKFLEVKALDSQSLDFLLRSKNVWMVQKSHRPLVNVPYQEEDEDASVLEGDGIG